ncbi:MAG: GAF domain-containing SpoIIE family protein phosphatase [Candidatus Eisenbacteria bacterium]
MADNMVTSTVFFLVGALIFLLGLLIFREAPRQRVNLVVSMMLFSAGFGAILGASGLLAESRSLDSRAYAYFVRTFAYLWEFFFPFLLLFALLYPREHRLFSRIPGIELVVFLPHAFHFVFVLVSSRTGGQLDVALAADKIPYSRPFLELAALFLRLVYRWHINLFSLVNLAFASTSVILLWRSYRRAGGLAVRQQLLVVLIGIGVCVGLYGTAVLIPDVFGRPVPLSVRSSLMVLSLTLGSAAIAYSVVRYRFLDTRVMARRSVLYGLVSAVFIAAYLTIVKRLDLALRGFTGTETAIFETVFVILGLIMFQPLINRLEVNLEEYLMRHRADYRNVLRRLSRDIVTVLDTEELSRRLLYSLRDALVAASGVLAVVEKGKDNLRVLDSFGLDKGKLEAETPAAVLEDFGSHPVLMSKDEALGCIADGSRRASLKDFVDRAAAVWVLPLAHHEEKLGILTLGEKVLPTRFHSEDRELLETLASQLSVALKNSFLYKETIEKKLMEEELMFARRIQALFLPREFPRLANLDVYGKNVPSRYVAGDYFDIIPLDGQRFLIAIGDVAGKGVPAALLMAMLQASLRTQCMEAKTIKQMVTTLNSLVYEMTSPEQFATFFLGMFDAAAMTLSYCNAGHCYPLVSGSDGIRYLEQGDLVLGVLRDAVFNEHMVRFSRRQLLLLYTDGVTEASRGPDDEFGVQRLLDVVRSYPSTFSAEEVVCAVEKAVVEYTGNPEPSDDMTMLALRVLG